MNQVWLNQFRASTTLGCGLNARVNKADVVSCMWIGPMFIASAKNRNAFGSMFVSQLSKMIMTYLEADSVSKVEPTLLTQMVRTGNSTLSLLPPDSKFDSGRT